MEAGVHESGLDALTVAIPSELHPLLEKRDGAPEVVAALARMYPPGSVGDYETGQKPWECVSQWYRRRGQDHQAVDVLQALYSQPNQCEDPSVHKAMPLVWLSDIYGKLGYRWHARRYAMLTLCEDALRDKGRINAEGGGIYFRLAWAFWMPDSDIRRYAGKAYQLSEQCPVESRYPEWLLQELGIEWMAEFPSPSEAMTYVASVRYIHCLLGQLGEGTGKALERLADYVLSLVPGFRTSRRVQTPSTDLDAVCCVEGPSLDFRSDLGRYVVCECKDWAKPVDFTAVAKFCRVLDSAKCRSGIIFSEKGVSGSASTEDGRCELLKLYHDRGIAVMVVDRHDLEAVAAGRSLITMLRSKYEAVRLDLAGC